ncbi:MAG: response regulator, partial [Clostridiales bacterium]|nr:response regulator [Clostridiales bacterium]
QGMSKEQVDKLFDEYSRFNVDANRTTEGTGLGMSITKNLIHMMNGSISVESEPGKGSVFTVRIPQGCPGEAALGKELAENLKHFQSDNKDYMTRVQITREPMPYGSVLIVDDVETNIYVATGLLTPYGLKVDSADSGFAAIDKVKEGKVYDIIFMDHMMPKMDGIEATSIIREMAYAEPIVALTANAVVGQSDIFLANGFDDFISKPIDIRQLNSVLNKFIRDKQTPEVLEAARLQWQKDGAPGAPEAQGIAGQAQDGLLKEGLSLGNPPHEGTNRAGQQYAVDPRMVEAFLRDAGKALEILGAIDQKQGGYDEEELRTYVIQVHGMKSALANMGQQALSDAALKLEQAGRDNDTGVIVSGTGDFLLKLKALTGEMKPTEEEAPAEAGEEDRPYLREKLLLIKEACEAYDKKTAREAIAELKEKAWTHQVRQRIEEMGEFLLHSDFDELTRSVEALLGEDGA